MLGIVRTKIENKTECNSALLLKPHILTVCKGEDRTPISEKRKISVELRKIQRHDLNDQRHRTASV